MLFFVLIFDNVFCLGSKVVYDDGDDEIEIVLKGVVRAEKLPDPTDFVPAILSRVKEEYVRRLYGVAAWEDATDFMTKLAARCEEKQGDEMHGGRERAERQAGGGKGRDRERWGKSQRGR